MENRYDAIIIGGGPAGLSAAIYLGRAQYKVLVIEKEKIGGQITITSEVVNYPGILKASGDGLTEEMKKQAIAFGAEFLIGEVLDTDLFGELKKVKTDRGEFQAFGIVVATGANPRKIGFTGEEEFQGRGVAYCATCDGEFFTGQDIFVIGGGFAAAEEAMFLTKYGRKVTIIVREPYFTCAESIAEEVLAHDKIEVFFETELLEISGESTLQKAVFRNNKTNETYEYHSDMPEGFGVFVFAGYVPASAQFKGKVELDKSGYLITDRDQKTSIDGVYGAGDICIKELRQVVTAVSDGAVAATSMEKYISGIHKKFNIKREKIHKTNIREETVKGAEEDEPGFINENMKAQLLPVFDKFERDILLKGYLDDSNISGETEDFLKEVGALSNKIKYVLIKKEEGGSEINYPSIMLCDASGSYLGVQFHGVPGGHEFNSFIVSLYNAAGPGQPIDSQLLDDIKAIDKSVNLKVAISLSCTMCPEVVMGAARIALENPNIEMEMYDLAHYPELKEEYQIKSVPCLIINDEEIHFGKKKIGDIISLISK